MSEKETKEVRFIVFFAMLLLLIFGSIFLWMHVNGIQIELPIGNQTKNETEILIGLIR